MPPRFRIVEEAEDWLVVDKPAPLLVHPSKPAHTVTLWHQLRGLLAFEIACGGQVSIINRLDRETSGLTLIAKNHATARLLAMQMEQRRIHKEYLAFAFGAPPDDEWTVDAPLLRQGEVMASDVYLRQMVHPHGAAARTRFRVECRFSFRKHALALVRAWPETGRLHQIRVHLAHSGHPIVGDKLYGVDAGCYLEFIQTGWTESLASRLLLSRQALHAAVLGVPALERQWSSPLPAEFDDVIRSGTQNCAPVP